MTHAKKFFVFMTITTIMAGCASGPVAQLTQEYGPPAQLTKNHDYEALAKWYEQEAASLRQRAKKTRSTVPEIEEYDSRGIYQDELTLRTNRNDLADRYSEAADHADKLAQTYRHRSHQTDK